MFLWFMERPPRNKTSRIELLNLVGTARCAVRAAFSGATMPPADARAGTSQRDVPTEVRFMGREHLQNPDVNRSHEPVAIPLNRPPAPSPPLGEKGRDEGVRFKERDRVGSSEILQTGLNREVVVPSCTVVRPVRNFRLSTG